MNDHVSSPFTYQLTSYRQSQRAISAVTNLVTAFYSATSLLRSSIQSAAYSPHNPTFSFFSCTLLPTKHGEIGFSGGHMNWFHNYVHTLSAKFRRHSECLQRSSPICSAVIGFKHIHR